MAGNMQHMAGPGQMMGQQMRNKNAQSAHMTNWVLQNILANTQPADPNTWQFSVNPAERTGKTMNLITNFWLATGGPHVNAANWGCQFERDQFHNSATKEIYENGMSNKSMEFFQKRRANGPGMQAGLNANIQQMAMQANQMGIGRGQGPQQAFQQFPQNMQQQMMQQAQQQQQGQQMHNQGMQAQVPHQALQQAQQQAQKQQQQQQQAQQLGMGMGMGMGMNMGMANAAGRGMTPVQMQQHQQQQRMAMAAAQSLQQQQQQSPTDISRMSAPDRTRVMQLAQKLMENASEQAKAATRDQLQKTLTPAQLNDYQAKGKDPLVLVYQSQALNMIRNSVNNLNRQQGGMGQNMNMPQAPMMQQQPSQQQLMQQRQNMMNASQQGGVNAANDFSQFNPNLESIQDQQMAGVMAEKAGQVVVPQSNRAAAAAQMNQNRANQQGQNPMARQQQQAQAQQAQAQQQQMQQMKMNQAAQQSQAQLQAQQQARSMQGQPGGMAPGMQPSQSPAMNTLNTPATASRPPNNANSMAGQGMAQGNVQFGNERFNQGVQRPNAQAWGDMLREMSSEEQRQVQGLPADKAKEIMMKWQNSRHQDQMAKAAEAGTGQMQNRQMNQFTPTMGGQMPQGMQSQQTAQGVSQMSPQIAHMMDMMEVPQPILQKFGAQLGPDKRKWLDLKRFFETNPIEPTLRQRLHSAQIQQFQALWKQRTQQMQGQQGQAGQQQSQAQQTVGMNVPANMQTTAGQMNPQQQFQAQQQQQAQQQAQQAQQQVSQQQQQQQQGMAGTMAVPPGNIPVTPGEIAAYRAKQADSSNMTDDQVRLTIQQLKRTMWYHQRAAAMAQRQGQGQPQGGMQNPMAMAQNPQQLQQLQQQQFQQQQQQQLRQQQFQAQLQLHQQQAMNKSNAQQAQQAAGQMSQGAQAQIGGQNKQNVASVSRQQAANNRAQPPKPSPAQVNKGLKRPSTDQSVDMGDQSQAAPTTAAPQAQMTGNQSTTQGQNAQQPRRGPGMLTPAQLVNLTPEQRARYEEHIKKFQSNNVKTTASVMDELKRLNEEARAEISQLQRQAVSLTPEALTELVPKLRGVLHSTTRFAKALSRWYNFSKDETKARNFFKARLHLSQQFQDGDQGTIPKDTLTVTSDEVEKYRLLIEGMAREVSVAFGQMKVAGQQQQQGGQQAPNAQMTQQQLQQQQQQLQLRAQAAHAAQAQQAQTTPNLNAASLDKNNASATEKKGVKQTGKAGKGSQPPAAPTTAQPPFPFGASSPHGNPNYIGRAKDMNLQLPPSRKKQKTQTGQTPGSSTASPQVGKGQSPEMRRTQEQAAPPKPVFRCTEPDCDAPTGYATEQALQQHVQEEHIRPREDPTKFVQEELALALGLEPDGSAKKPVKDAEAATAMAPSSSKQGLTPANLAATPKSQDMVMKRSASGMGKPQDKKAGATPKSGEGKTNGDGLALDPWASSTVDPQSLKNLANGLGANLGLSSVFIDLALNRKDSISPKDTPDSLKDSGSSEPNSDIPETATLDIGLDWMNFDTSILLDMDDAAFEANGGLIEHNGQTVDILDLYEDKTKVIDWSDAEEALSKPYKFDASQYRLKTS